MPRAAAVRIRPSRLGASRFEKTRAIVLDCRWMRDRSRSIGIANRPAGETVAHGDGEGTARGRERTGDEHMPRFVKLATLDELPAGAAQEVEFEGRVYAIYNVEGVISVIDGICPHQGGPLADGTVEGTTVTCPWHGWQFDIRTGKT